MALFSRVKQWVSNEILTAQDLNAEFDNILANAKSTSIMGYSSDVTQMQSAIDPGGLGTEQLASNTAEEIQRLRYKIKQIIGGAQWYSAPSGSLAAGGIGTTALANLGVTTAKVADGAITSAKLADGSVTPNKIGPFVSAVSTSVSSYSTSNTVYQDVASVTITTTGRPVWVGVVSNGLSSQWQAYATSGTSFSGFMQFLRGATVIGGYTLSIPIFSVNTTAAHNAGQQNDNTTLATINLTSTPAIGLVVPGDHSVLDMTPTAGTYTYKVQLAAGFNSNTTLTQFKLVAYEL